MNEWLQRRPLFANLFAFLGGALLNLAFAPFNFWYLAVLLPIVLLWCWDHASPSQAAWRGGWFGLGLFGFGLYWIFISLHDYGNAPAPFAALATLLVVLVMALYPALTAWLLSRWGGAPSPIRWVLIFPAVWALLEWVRSWLFTGFPWLAIGYSQSDAPLGELAPYIGVFGVGWALLCSAGLLWTFLNHRATRLWTLGAVAIIWLGAWALGRIVWVEPAGTPLQIAIIQGNIAQERKWRPEVLDETLYRYVQLSLPEQARSDVIIWPETAIPVFYDQVRPFIAALAQQAQQHHVDYVLGIPTGSLDSGTFQNSVAHVGATVDFYHKQRLLPFGEYLPLRGVLLFFRRWVTIPMSDFTPGQPEQALLRVANQPVGISICFEAVFGNAMRQPLPTATWLINVSNDAWFKDSTAPHQHLQIVRMRAWEMGRYLARATNTGISALLDARGRIIIQGAQFQEQVVRGEVQPLQGLTPYGRFGDLPLIMALLLLLGGGLFLSKSRR